MGGADFGVGVDAAQWERALTTTYLPRHVLQDLSFNHYPHLVDDLRDLTMFSTLRVFYTLSNIIFLLPFPSLCTENEASFPYAMTLTPWGILVSTVTLSGDMQLYRFDAAGRYKSYIDSILHYHGSKNRPRAVDIEADDATIAIIRDVFNAVRRNMTSTLGHKPRFAALYRSSFFNTSSLEAARHALYPRDTFEKNGPKKLGNVYGGACFAYGLEKCENHGRTAAECKHEEWLIDLVLVVEYEKQYLSISIVEEDRDGFGQSHSSFAAEFGEETGRALRDVSSAFTHGGLQVLMLATIT